MSADNTILILGTLRRDGQPGYEYRVDNVQAAENVYDPIDPDYPSKENAVLVRDTVLYWFARAPVFFDELAAMKYAKKIERKQDIVEYGVKLCLFSVYFPASDAKRARRKLYSFRHRGN
jgi:hypothetical protein